MKIPIAVYGSLRQGEALNRDMEYQYTTQLRGLKLFDLHCGYPAAILGSADELVTVDLMLVTPERFAYLNNMETGAGYDLIAVTINGTEAFLWRMDKEVMALYYPKFTRVDSGDWTQYLHN